MPASQKLGSHWPWGLGDINEGQGEFPGVVSADGLDRCAVLGVGWAWAVLLLVGGGQGLGLRSRVAGRLANLGSPLWGRGRRNVFFMKFMATEHNCTCVCFPLWKTH